MEREGASTAGTGKTSSHTEGTVFHRRDYMTLHQLQFQTLYIKWGRDRASHLHDALHDSPYMWKTTTTPANRGICTESASSRLVPRRISTFATFCLNNSCGNSMVSMLCMRCERGDLDYHSKMSRWIISFCTRLRYRDQAAMAAKMRASLSCKMPAWPILRASRLVGLDHPTLPRHVQLFFDMTKSSKLVD